MPKYPIISNEEMAAAMLAKNNNVSEAAEMLGIYPSTIYMRLKQESLQKIIKQESIDFLAFVRTTMRSKIKSGDCSVSELNSVVRSHKYRDYIGYDIEQDKNDNANKELIVQFIDVPDKQDNASG